MGAVVRFNSVNMSFAVMLMLSISLNYSLFNNFCDDGPFMGFSDNSLFVNLFGNYSSFLFVGRV